MPSQPRRDFLSHCPGSCPPFLCLVCRVWIWAALTEWRQLMMLFSTRSWDVFHIFILSNIHQEHQCNVLLVFFIFALINFFFYCWSVPKSFSSAPLQLLKSPAEGTLETVERLALTSERQRVHELESVGTIVVQDCTHIPKNDPSLLCMCLLITGMPSPPSMARGWSDWPQVKEKKKLLPKLLTFSWCVVLSK